MIAARFYPAAIIELPTEERSMKNESNKRVMLREIGKPVFFAILAVVVVVILWVGWNMTKNPYERGLDEKALFLAAEKKAKSNGIDIRTVPNWGALYYKYHPEEKPPTAAQAAGPVPAPDAIPGTTPGATTAPGAAGSGEHAVDPLHAGGGMR
jgi:hypothetical protein